MSVRLSCPSCNTAFDLDAVPADRRAACPRCGDVFPVRGEVAEHATAPPGRCRRRKSEPPPAKCKWSLGRAVAIVVALGLLGFAVGFAVYYNRGSKPKEDEPQTAGMVGRPCESAVRSPADSDSLPAECNVVFAVQPGPVTRVRDSGPSKNRANS